MTYSGRVMAKSEFTLKVTRKHLILTIALHHLEKANKRIKRVRRNGG